MTIHASATGLLARLRAAQEHDSLEVLVERWLAFRGTLPGEPVEIQALHIPGRYQDNRFAHSTTAAGLVALLTQADRYQAQGIYYIANRVDAAVASRAEIDRWHPSQKGESTTDSDIRARCLLFVDVDARRPKGTSATEEQLHGALEVAERIYHRLREILGTTKPLAIGHSGNGGAVLIALDGLPDSAQLGQLIRGVLAALREAYASESVEIDVSVSDAKRLCPAWGTTKRKGASGLADRPHRRTALVCDAEPERISLDALISLLASLREFLNPEQLAAVDKAIGKPRAQAPAAPAQRPTPARPQTPAVRQIDTPFARANALDVSDVCARLGLLDADGSLRCVGCGTESGAGDTSVAIIGNGVKCLHARCSMAGAPGKPGYRTPVDIVAEHEGVTGKAAVDLLAEWFNFEGFPVERQERHAREPLHDEHEQREQAWTAADVDAEERAAIAEEAATPPPHASTTRRPLFTIHGPDHIFAPLPPLEYAVGQLLPKSSLMILGGYGSSSKTWLALDMLCAVGAGDRWLGAFPCAAGLSTMIDYENGDRELRRRLQALAAGRALSRIDGLQIAPMPGVYLHERRLEDELHRIADGASLIVLDSLRAASPLGDENDSAFRLGLDMLKRVAEHTACSFCVLAHSKKSGTQQRGQEPADQREALRGSSAIFDAADVILVSSLNREDECIDLVQTKARNGKPAIPDTFPLRILDTVPDPERGTPAGVTVSGLAASAETASAKRRESFEERCARLRNVIRRKPDMGTMGLRQEIGGKHTLVDGALEYLINRGEVRDLGEGGRHRYRIYDAPPPAEPTTQGINA
jgi:hypothetical protein